MTRNPELGNTLVWVLPNIWKLDQVRDTKFSTNIYNKMLLNPAKFQDYCFYRFWVVQGKPTGGKYILTQIRVNGAVIYIFSIHFLYIFYVYNDGYSMNIFPRYHSISWLLSLTFLYIIKSTWCVKYKQEMCQELSVKILAYLCCHFFGKCFWYLCVGGLC